MATADLIISYPMHLSEVQHLTKIFNHYLGMEYKGGKVIINTNIILINIRAKRSF